jgi:hypothetical protein
MKSDLVSFLILLQDMTLPTFNLTVFDFSFFQINPEAPSLTDWIQAIGVILASIGLLVNFYYQRKTLLEQLKTREIEEERDRRSIMPWMELKHEYDETNFCYVLTFICRGHEGRLLFISPLIQEMNAYNLIATAFKEEDIFTLTIPKAVVEQYSGQLGSDRRFYKIQYMDKDSRPYEQSIFFTGYSMYLNDPMQYIHIRMMEKYDIRKSRNWLRFFKRKKVIQ